MSSEKAYATSYWRLIVTLTISLTISEIQPLIARNIPFKIAAKLLQMETWLLLTAFRKSPAPYMILQSRSHTTYRLATIPHDWHTIVGYDPSRSSKVNDLHAI